MSFSREEFNSDESFPSKYASLPSMYWETKPSIFHMHTTIQAPSVNPRQVMKRAGAFSVFFQKKGAIFSEEGFSTL